jgi:hypothetical protein
MKKTAAWSIVAGALCVLAVAGCGGGFGDDSDNADNFNSPLFGVDDDEIDTVSAVTGREAR